MSNWNQYLYFNFHSKVWPCSGIHRASRSTLQSLALVTLRIRVSSWSSAVICIMTKLITGPACSCGSLHTWHGSLRPLKSDIDVTPLKSLVFPSFFLYVMFMAGFTVSGSPSEAFALFAMIPDCSSKIIKFSSKCSVVQHPILHTTTVPSFQYSYIVPLVQLSGHCFFFKCTIKTNLDLT